MLGCRHHSVSSTACAPKLTLCVYISSTILTTVTAKVQYLLVSLQSTSLDLDLTFFPIQTPKLRDLLEEHVLVGSQEGREGISVKYCTFLALAIQCFMAYDILLYVYLQSTCFFCFFFCQGFMYRALNPHLLIHHNHHHNNNTITPLSTITPTVSTTTTTTPSYTTTITTSPITATTTSHPLLLTPLASLLPLTVPHHGYTSYTTHDHSYYTLAFIFKRDGIQ